MDPDKDTNKIAVCIINFHQKELTLNCLTSLAQQTNQNFHVFLLDNESKRELSSDELKPFPFVTFFTHQKNTGFAGGNNLLIKAAIKDHYQHVILLNNDTVVNPSFIEVFFHHLRASQPFDVTGCVITYLSQPQRMWFAGGRLIPLVQITQHPLMNQPLSAIFHKPAVFTCDWVTGCAFGFHSSLINKIGLLDESFFTYLEDVDFCLKAKQAGGHCQIINQPLVRHAVSPSIGIKGSNTMTSKRLEYQARNAVRIIYRHFPQLPLLRIIIHTKIQILIFLLQRRMTIQQIPFFLNTVYQTLRLQ